MSELGIWLIVGFLLILSEFLIPGFIIFFFGVAAIIVGILQYFFCFMTLPISICATFVLGIALLLLCRRFMPQTMVGTTMTDSCEQDVDNDGIIGVKVPVVQRITPDVSGKVELHGTLWNASADVAIDVGSVVTIVSKKNLTLQVKL